MLDRKLGSMIISKLYDTQAEFLFFCGEVKRKVDEGDKVNISLVKLVTFFIHQ